jgi:hypothetical protein
MVIYTIDVGMKNGCVRGILPGAFHRVNIDR